MSTFKVTAEKLTIHEHPNADALELAQVGGFRAVVAKGAYRTGDYALYIPEAGVLPDRLIDELGLTGRLAGKDKNRVKAVRLRGEISQGIVCRPSMFDWTDAAYWVDAHADRTDFAVELNIDKYVPPIPTHMSGDVEHAPELIRWPDIENLRRYPGIFSPGERVVATEKIHGTCCALTLDNVSQHVWVSSKGLGHQHLALREADSNLYWRAVRAHGLAAAATLIAAEMKASRVGIFGEVYGKGVQDLDYGANAGADDALGYRVFDIAVEFIEDPRGVEWLAPDLVEDLCRIAGVPVVPVLYRGPYDFDALAEVAAGPSTVGGEHIREGVVIRPATPRHSEVLGGRKIAKLINPDYLLRKNGTEFE